MLTWIGIVLVVIGCVFGLYKIFRGAPGVSGDVSTTSNEETGAVANSRNADSSVNDAGLPKPLVPRVVDAAVDGSVPATAQQHQGGLFSDFDSILGGDASSVLTPPRPEELPMSEDDMVFGSVTPARFAELRTAWVLTANRFAGSHVLHGAVDAV
jgi:hypothetical protein